MKKPLALKIKYLHEHMAKESSNICFITRTLNVPLTNPDQNLLKSPQGF
jgi:hypothetical protein